MLDLADGHGAFGPFSREKAEAEECWRNLPHEAGSNVIQGPFPLPFINVAKLEGEPVPERRFAVSGKIPIGEVSGLSGDGGVGKTTLAAQLCNSISRRDQEYSDWVTHEIAGKGPTIFYTGEEPWREIHFMLDGFGNDTI